MNQLNEIAIIKEKLKKYERILLILFKKTFIKVYNIGRLSGINKILE